MILQRRLLHTETRGGSVERLILIPQSQPFVAMFREVPGYDQRRGRRSFPASLTGSEAFSFASDLH
jgi:hypothetical protein